MLNNILHDIKVLDLSTVLAGPSVGMFLGELGAEVLKIENPKTKGDVTRQWKNPNENVDDPISAYYASVNGFKKIMYLDLNDEKSITTIHQMIPEFDIILCNFKQNDDKKFQLDYPTLKAINPKIIYAHISGFGKNHPRVAYDLILQAETGFMYLNREAHQLPNKMPVALIDVLAAHQLKEGILLALYQRLKNNKGAYVHCSLYDAAVTSLVNQAANYLIANYNPPPLGSKHPNIAPYGEIFFTQDQQLITFAIGSDEQFQKLCELLNLPDIPKNNDFSNNLNRVKNREKLYQLLQNAIKELNAEWIYENCLKNNIPVALIKDVEQVMKNPLTKRLIKNTTIENKPVQILTTIAFEMYD